MHAKKFSASMMKAANAAGTTPEKFATGIRGLLSRSRCRDTKPIFNNRVLSALSCAQ